MNAIAKVLILIDSLKSKINNLHIHFVVEPVESSAHTVDLNFRVNYSKR